MTSRMQQVCTGGFIQNNKGEILFIKRSDTDDFMPGFWELPGGGTEYGENIQEALRREVKEECGIDIKVLLPLGVHSYAMNTKNKTIQRVEITFLCKSKRKQNVVLGHEHSDYKWVLPNEVDQLKLSEYLKIVVEEAIQNPLVTRH